MSRLGLRLQKDGIGEDCVIMGNGPSLNTSLAENKGFLEDKVLVSVNFFPLTKHFSELKPRYLVITAPELWLDDTSERYKNKSNELFTAINDKTDWELILLLPSKARKHKRWKDLLSNNKISFQYYNPTPVDGFKCLRHFAFKRNLGMPRPHNVLIPSIILMLNYGYKKLYLIGADHSWLPEITVNDDNQVLINQKHFYDENTSVARPMTKVGKGSRKLHEVLQKFYYSFSSYFIIDKYAITLKAKIYNATPGSFIDAFERVDLNKTNK